MTAPFTPKVSVAVITYNHAPFIAQALESALGQQTDIGVEIVVGDDCSTDGTREIVENYARQYPDRIRVVTSPSNVGMLRNAKRVIDACRGDYISALEGDDFWTDPLKLHLQAELLDRHPEAFICGARAQILVEGDGAPGAIAPAEPPEVLAGYGARELFEGRWWFRTCTKMWPRRLVQAVPARYQGDWEAMFWLISQHHFGTVCFLDRVVGVYREHAGGIWSSTSDVKRGLSDVRSLYRVAPLFRGSDRKYLQALMQHRVDALLAHGDVSRRPLVVSAAMNVSRGPSSPSAWRALGRSLVGKTR